MKDSQRKAMFARRKGEENYPLSANNVEIGKVHQTIIQEFRNEQPKKFNKFDTYNPFIGSGKLFDTTGNEFKVDSGIIRKASIKHDIPVRFVKLALNKLADRDNGQTFANEGVHL